MLKYTGKYWLLMSVLMRKPLLETFGKKVATKALKGGKKIYREMLATTDDIGADNPMASNIYLSFTLMAMWKAADGAIEPESLAQIVNELMEKPVIVKFMGGIDLNKPTDCANLYAKLKTNKQWADDHPEYRNSTWDFNFDESKHRDGIYYHYTHCPIEKFARENGYLEVLPVGCAFDYTSARMKHAVLHRDQTLAKGGSMCDFWLVPDQVKDPR